MYRAPAPRRGRLAGAKRPPLRGDPDLHGDRSGAGRGRSRAHRTGCREPEGERRHHAVGRCLGARQRDQVTPGGTAVRICTVAGWPASSISPSLWLRRWTLGAGGARVWSGCGRRVPSGFGLARSLGRRPWAVHTSRRARVGPGAQRRDPSPSPRPRWGPVRGSRGHDRRPGASAASRSHGAASGTRVASSGVR